MSWETDLLLRLHDASTPALDCFFRAVTRLGDAKVLGALFALQSVFFCLRWERRRTAVTAGLGLGTFVLDQGLKLLVMRPRPELWPWLLHAKGWAFPSGHALGSAVFYGWCAFLLGEAFPKRKALVWAGAAGLLFLIGFSRLYLGVHWPADVLGGWLIGGAWLASGIAWHRRRSDEVRTDGLDG